MGIESAQRLRPCDCTPFVPKTQILDGYALARSLGIFERPFLNDLDVCEASFWSLSRERFTPAQFAALWAQQLRDPAVSPDYPVIFYFHVPFCSHTCSFCSCYRLALTKDRAFLEQYTDYLCAQLDFFAPTFAGVPVRTYNVGGGTPSLLSAEQLHRVLSRLHQRYAVRLDGPVSTVEMSFPTMDDARLDVLAAAGVPRISVGVQTLKEEARRAQHMFDIDLGGLASRVERVMKAGQACNLDLVLGIPGESAEEFLAGFRSLLALRPSQLSVHALNSTFFERRKGTPPGDGLFRDAEFLRAVGTGMGDEVAKAGYSPYPLNNRIDAVVFLSPEFERSVRPSWEAYRRSAAGEQAVRLGTSTFSFGSICNLTLVPNYLLVCSDQEYRFAPDRVMYQCCRDEVFSVLYPPADRGPDFTAEQLALLGPVIDRLRSIPRLMVMPASEEVLLEFPDEGQKTGRGHVFIRPFASGRPCHQQVGPFALVFNDLLTRSTEWVLGAARRLLERGLVA